MDLDIWKKIDKTISQGIDNFIKELSEGLKKMEQELVVDRFEEDIAICEDRKTGKKVEINKSELPQEVKEGNVLKYQNGKYKIDVEKHEEISKRIKEKMDNLWNN